MDSKATRKSRPRHKRKPMPRKRQRPKAKHLAELEEARARIKELEEVEAFLRGRIHDTENEVISYKNAAILLAFALIDETDAYPADALNSASAAAICGEEVPAGCVAEAVMYAYGEWQKRRE